MNEISVNESGKLKIGITHGDLNGIGYEIIIKALSDNRIPELFIPVVYGHSKVASYHRKSLSIGEFNFNIVKNAENAVDKKVNLINIYEHDVKIELGQSTQIAGKLALDALKRAVEDLRKGSIDAVVTAPINKENIQSNEFSFPGHTEFFASSFNSRHHMMMMVSNDLRIGVATGHIPLKDVVDQITPQLIEGKLRIMNYSLLRDFGIRKPKIAVLGLNPHAGESGLLGKEEEEIITPVIRKLQDEDFLIYGPFPADGFFGSNDYRKFDGILAMYHDQGLIPFKSLAFDSGTNFTAGLPIVRTSPGHGTAYDLAGKDQASPSSMLAAIFTAIDIVNYRKMYEEISSEPLPISAEVEGQEDESPDLTEEEHNE